MGVIKAHSSLQRECGLYSNPRGKSIAHIDRGASGCGEGFDCFFGPCPARLWRLLTLKLTAAKGEQDGNDGPRPFAPFFMGSCTQLFISYPITSDKKLKPALSQKLRAINVWDPYWLAASTSTLMSLITGFCRGSLASPWILGRTGAAVNFSKTSLPVANSPKIVY